MSSKPIILVCVGSCIGVADAADVRGQSYDNARVREVAHIYYNLASGERVVTLAGDGQTVGSDTGTSVPIWSAGVGNTCGSVGGYTTSYFFAVDNPGSTSLSTNIAVLDHGDIALDTVVDCFQINWVLAHPDTDTDLNSIGDGVPGLAGEWTIWDADNGRAENQSTRLPLLEVRFDNLPGNIAAPGFLSGYTANIDLVAFGTATDLTFEIGDSDGDCNVAAFCNSSVDYGDGTFGPIAGGDRDNDGLLDSDLDGDGLFDWAWSVRFYQPGTVDLDGDGSIDGVPAPSDQDTIGVSLGAPEGMAVQIGPGDWDWVIDTSAAAAGTGSEDHLAIYAPLGPNGELIHAQDIGGNFACEGGLIGDGGMGYTPYASLQVVLYGANVDPPFCGSADLNNDGMLDFFDVSLFLQQFNAGGDYNGDGATDFFDVSAFLQDFNAGCA